MEENVYLHFYVMCERIYKFLNRGKNTLREYKIFEYFPFNINLGLLRNLQFGGP